MQATHPSTASQIIYNGTKTDATQAPVGFGALISSEV